MMIPNLPAIPFFVIRPLESPNVPRPHTKATCLSDQLLVNDGVISLFSQDCEELLEFVLAQNHLSKEGTMLLYPALFNSEFKY